MIPISFICFVFETTVARQLTNYARQISDLYRLVDEIILGRMPAAKG